MYNLKSIINKRKTPDSKPTHMPSKNNILKKGWRSWTYLPGLWDNIQHIPYVVKWAYQRIVRGYADADCWDLDLFYTNLFAESLDWFRQVTGSFPGHDEGATEEGWNNVLKTMSEKFYRSNEDNDYYPKDKWQAYHAAKGDKLFDEDETSELQALRDAWLEEEKANAEARDRDLSDALDSFKYWFRDLWD